MTTGKLDVTLPSDREIAMTRVFNAPRELVFEALNRPDLVRRWMGVLPGWSWAVCEIDLRVGGTYRYLWNGPEGATLGLRGTYRDVVRPKRTVATGKYDESWYPGGEVSTTDLAEKDGKTTLTMTVLYDSKEVRDMVLKSPAKEGLGAGFDLLDQVLADLVAGESRPTASSP